jgi:hypothetical protein
MNANAEIPQGTTKEEVKQREKIIQNFYASWIETHSEKRIGKNNFATQIKYGKPKAV